MMRYRKTVSFAMILLGLGLVTASRAGAGEMALGFSWKGIEGCRGAGISPGFTVTNAPTGTSTLSFTLEMLGAADRVDNELGGSVVSFPANGIVPPGLVYANGPCHPGQYRWVVVARDAMGAELARARLISTFPPGS